VADEKSIILSPSGGGPEWGLISLSQRGRVRVGVNIISWLSFPPPAPIGADLKKLIK